MKPNAKNSSESCQRTTAYLGKFYPDNRLLPCTSNKSHPSQTYDSSRCYIATSDEILATRAKPANNNHTIKERTAKSIESSKQLLDNVNLDGAENEEDDDVICIPAPPPPLVCIESTDNEESNSEQEIEKDVTANDTHRIKEEVSGITTAEPERNSIAVPDKVVSSNVPPSPAHEVKADIYESESSEVTDISESDSSNTQININRSKRMMKYKSSSSNDGSDTSDGTESDDDGMLFLDILKETNTPYLQRGEAIKNVNFFPEKRVAARRSTTSHHSEEESIPMLSCIVHDVALSVTTDDQSINKNEDSSSIDARHVIDRVLEKTIKTTVDDYDGDQNSSNIEKNTAEQSRIDENHIENANNCAEASTPNNENQSSSIADIFSAVLSEISVTTTASETSEPVKPTNVSLVSLPVDPEIGWNEEMKRFYHNSWGGENFNVTVSQRPMTNLRHEWDVLDADKRVTNHNSRNSDLQCIYCGENGHIAKDCSMLSRRIKCHMCGLAGHREPECPQTMCLRCGSSTRVYSHGCDRCQHLPNKRCPLCKTKGHGVRECPDKWRRYHSTIVPGQPLTKLPLIFNKTRYCCICAGKGHTAEYCPQALSFLDTPAPSIRIQSYCNVYDPIVSDNTEETSDDVAPFALICDPVEDFQFSWDIDESSNRFYGRIMAATNITRTTNSSVELQQNDLKENAVEASVSTGSGLLKESSDDGRPVRAAKFNKRAREAFVISTPECAEMSGPAAKIRKEQRNKRKRSEERFRGAEEMNEILENTVKTTKEFDRNVESFEPNHVEDGLCAISVSVEKAIIPAKRIRFDSDSTFCCSKKNPLSLEITQSLKELTSYNDTDLKLAELIPTSTGSKIQCDFHQENEDLPNIISQQADVTPLQLRLSEKATTDYDRAIKKQAYKWKLTIKNLPSSRLRLIKFIEGHIMLMHRSHDNVNDLYQRMCVKLDEENIQGAARIRRKLNIILMGRAGLHGSGKGSGSLHLRLLQNILKSLYSSKKSFVPLKVRLDVFRHYEYIFTPFEHDDYPRLIAEYNAIREQPLELLESSNQAVDGAEMLCDLDNINATNQSAQLLKANLESNDKPHLAESFDNKNLSDCIQFPENVQATSEQHTIYMTTAHYNCLMTANTFLRDSYAKHGVVVRIKEFGFCVIFLVDGKGCERRNFYNDIIANNEKILSKMLVEPPLIKFFKNEVKQMDLPSTGTVFSDSETDGGVRIEWHCFGMFIVDGTTKAQNNFQNRLLAYCQSETSRIRWEKTRTNRIKLIGIIKNKLKKLGMKPGNVRRLYKILCECERDMDTYRADRVRALLNLILMGQAGLRDGPFHLKSLQSFLHALQMCTGVRAPKQLKCDMFQHYQYIFLPFRHNDYPGLINEYEALPKHKRRPKLDLPADENSLELANNPHLAI